MSEEEARKELEDITKELVYLHNKKNRTDIREKNKEYREICFKIYCKERKKKLSFISYKKELWIKKLTQLGTTETS